MKNSNQNDGKNVKEKSLMKEPSTCMFYVRNGCCPFGECCRFDHPINAFPRIVILHHIYPDPDVFYQLLGQESAPVDPILKQRLFDAFYVDLYHECLQFGPILDILIAGNNLELLSGNAWVYFEDTDAAKAAKIALNGRYYAGRKIRATMWDYPRLTGITCNCIHGKVCDYGTKCGYVHPIDPSPEVQRILFNRDMRSVPYPPFQEHIPRLSPNELLYKDITSLK